MIQPNSKLIKSILNLFNQGHERSIKAKKNILASFIIKGSSILLGLLIVPLTINYVNASRYGIWLTLSSVVAWFSFFDIGLTQGLRNKFAEAKAKNLDEEAQVYVSTTYAILAIIFFIVWLMFFLINPFINWCKILNVPENLKGEMSLLAMMVFTYFCISFVIKIVTTILTADQQPAKSEFIDLSGQTLSLILVYILVKTTEGSLIKLGLVLCLSPILILLSANLILFNGRYQKYRPKFSKVRFSYAKELFNLGVIFFVIQVAGVIQFQTANIIIAHYFGTSDVTSYNIVYKYFGVLNMVSITVLWPFWSASTEAYFRNEIGWIKNAIKRYTQLNIILLIVGIFMLIFSAKIYHLWLGNVDVIITPALSVWGFVYFILMIFGAKYVIFLNSINALHIQFLACIISPFLYFAIAMFLIKEIHLGVQSLFIASLIANFNAFLLAPLQYKQIIFKSRKGIWIK
jgi:O-antigen/teichoic acid export membrane protein